MDIVKYSLRKEYAHLKKFGDELAEMKIAIGWIYKGTNSDCINYEFAIIFRKVDQQSKLMCYQKLSKKCV